MIREELHRWITALESGEYQQCQGRLYLPSTSEHHLSPTGRQFCDAHCALGVLAVLRKGSRVLDSPLDYPRDLPVELLHTVLILGDHGPLDQYAQVLSYLKSEAVIIG